LRRAKLNPIWRKAMLREGDHFERSLNLFMYRLSSLGQIGDVAVELLRTIEFRGFWVKILIMGPKIE
jgi:hypothetical protein